MNKCHVLIIFIVANIRKSNSMSLASIREKNLQTANNMIVTPRKPHYYTTTTNNNNDNKTRE